MASPKLTDRTSFSAPAGFWEDFNARAKAQGYESGSEYLRALYEADLSYGLRPAGARTAAPARSWRSRQAAAR